MSSRGRRGRGRPPKSSYTAKNNKVKVNFLKPRYLRTSTGQGSRSSTPVNCGGDSLDSTASDFCGENSRVKNRESNKKVKGFFHQDFKYLYRGSDPEDELEDFHSSDSHNDLMDDGDDQESDISCLSDDNFSVLSQSSLSTIASTPVKRKYSKRSRDPVFLQDREKPPITVPKSSEDLLLPCKYVMQATGIYEVIRHFRHIVRLSPFSFEDFCASLISDEQSVLLAEVHIQLLKTIIREEDANNTWFGPHDTKDSVNVQLFLIDSMTWHEVLRSYLHCDTEFEYILPALQDGDYPFTSIDNKLKVLQFLCDQVLNTNHIRDQVISEGNIKYDDHCRVCHKLGDLLCCETCSAVFHLDCLVPPMNDVPDDDWQCVICKAHQVPGVTDCITEAEKSGMFARQDSLGWDRDGRKYWFLCRRILVEGIENDFYYYSTKSQFDELLEILDPHDLEADLCRAIEEVKEEIIKHMNITEKLTNSAKGNKKSYLDIHNANIAKQQAERVALKAKAEAEKQAQLEKEETETIKVQFTSMNNNVNPEISGETGVNDNKNSTEEALETEVESIKTGLVNADSQSNGEVLDSTVMEIECCVLMHIKYYLDVPKEVEKKCQPNSSTADNNISVENNSKPVMVVKPIVQETNDTDADVGSSTITEIPDKFQLPMNEGKDETKMELDDDLMKDESTPEKGVVTRSKTGSLQPRTFNMEALTSRSFLSVMRKGDEKDQDSTIVVLNKDGEVSRINRTGRQTGTAQPVYFKLGMEGNFKSYVNQYTTNTLALNKPQHAEERSKRQHLSHKYSMTPASEFKWSGSIHGSRALCVGTLRQTIIQLENNIHAPFLHHNWAVHRLNWTKAVNMCTAPSDFALALAILDASIKPVLFNHIWHDSLGHTRLQKITALEREERKKQEKKDRRDNPEEEVNRKMWVKYALGLKHCVWKLKGEEYRITGAGGWCWTSLIRRAKYENSNKMGLRAGPFKVMVVDESTKEKPRSMLWSDFCKNRCKTDIPTSMEVDGENEIKVNILNDGLRNELVDVCSHLSDPERKFYSKIGKPSKLDNFLDRRIRQTVMEQKLKSEKDAAMKIEVKTEDKEEDVDVEDCSNDDDHREKLKLLTAYDKKYPCYSPTCPRKSPMQKTSVFSIFNSCYTPICNEIIALETKLKKSEINDSILNTKCEGKIKREQNDSKDLQSKMLDSSEIQYSSIDTKGRVYLAKFMKLSKKIKKLNKGALPMCCKFESRDKSKSILFLPQYELNKLSRRGGHKEVAGYNSSAKINLRAWPYPCPRPCFKTCWRFRTQVIKSIHAAGLQLRILWSCLRWDDMNVKPPPGGANTITSETEVITSEILKRRDVGQFGLRSEFLLRKILVPIDLPSKPREKVVSQRKGLRERKRAESPVNKAPSVTEIWMPEEDLELWEIKQFGEKVEKQQKDAREKVSQHQAQATAAQIKAQMEEQLKQQRLALQQKRLQESQAKLNNAASTNVAASPAITLNKPLTVIGTVNNTNKSALTTLVSQANTTSGTPYKGIRRIFTTKSTKPGQLTPVTIARNVSTDGSAVRLPLSATILPKATTILATNIASRPSVTSSPRPTIVTVRALNPPVSVGITAPVATPQLQAAPAQAAPVRAQIQIIQSPTGQLQVRGLMQGQQLVRLPDGRFQLIQVPTAVQPVRPQAQVSGPIQITTVVSQPQVVSTNLASIRAATLAPKLPTTSTVAGVTQTSPTLQIKTVSSQQPVNVAPALQPITPKKEVSSQLMTSLLSSPSTASPVLTTTSAKVSAVSTSNSTPVKSVQSIAPSPTQQSAPGTTVISPPGSPKFVLTPQITQQIVKRALLNPSVTPEIQQKLLALQKHQLEQTVEPSIPCSSSSKSKSLKSDKAPSLSYSVDRNIRRQALNIEQREENQRLAICHHVLRGVLDKIDRDERNHKRMIKQKESQEERKKVVMANRLHQLLFKQKELLKRDMLKKRALLEKDLQIEIREEMVHVAQVVPDNKKFSSERFNRKRKVESESYQAPVVTPPKPKKQKTVQTKKSPVKPTQLTAKIVCICKKQYDPAKFMIGCDSCAKWFHPNCVNLNDSQVQSMEKFICPDCAPDTGEQLYCLCKQPYDDSQFYICCDRCQDWFHGRCVGVLQSEADSIEEYVCPTCQGNTEINHANMKQLTTDDYEELRHLLRSLRSHKCSWPFSKPVDEREAPDYYHVIKEPMDLQTMDKKLNNKRYEILSDFIGDVTKIFDNCRYFNPRESTFYRCAEVLESFFVQKIKKEDTVTKNLSSDDAVTVSQLNLVDLAGSERNSQTGNTGERFKEGYSINLSLLHHHHHHISHYRSTAG
ncbi:Nucleosome-remodeling factor subunit BPTF [Nymphon striatum]|nr:Nucleosome-remodeling factor subunit BPTF [Nymphon striatum]